MGLVYLARQAALDRLVALKVLSAGRAARSEGLDCFAAEARAVASLQHPNIIQIYNVGEHDGLPYLALEFCPGGNLDKQIRGTALPPRGTAAMAEQLARVVHAAHEKGIVHRGLKPANVLFGEGGVPKIAGFGLAKNPEGSG
jgi:eukaryotic-like serine/threonine-protein kinase